MHCSMLAQVGCLLQLASEVPQPALRIFLHVCKLPNPTPCPFPCHLVQGRAASCTSAAAYLSSLLLT